MKLGVIKLWAFWYNPMIHESASYIKSYHKTKKGALKAKNEHMALAKIEWDESNEYHKKWCDENGFKYRPISKFGSFESWYVAKFDLDIKD